MSDSLRVNCEKCGKEHMNGEVPCPHCGYDWFDVNMNFKTKKIPIKLEKTDIKELKELARELLKFAIKMSEEPYYIVKPTINIVKKYSKTIEKLELLD